jgi:hypothetical protein
MITVSKPWNSAVIVYRPGGRFSIVATPAAVAAVERGGGCPSRALTAAGSWGVT